MSLPWIVKGDKTSHGGTVIEGDPTFDTHGKPVALVGHMVTCPKCKGGPFPIVTGAPDFVCNGRLVARHGDKTACGATLISGQAASRWSSEVGSVTAIRTNGSSRMFEDDAAPEYEHYYSLVDEADNPVDGYCYDLHCDGEIHTRAGSFASGITARIVGNKETGLIAWLAKDGGLRS
ncbi:MAG TPA: PAAR domain-containing protein [Noviherbaspirillum sp.]|uniref:PAAR domain-containing protein n=1 Tax=Noviherbaspirillum sp. TaxID=1926288 RepID=UPI002B4849C3|nr:PAAR domain-containing protein [Noviherbaspirillum sp.]HJV86281.1 PAAR domain-containing protein [Noviherbaspirillum sp.]